MTNQSPIPVGAYQVLTSGLRIHYTEIGKPVPGRPSILCLHGGGPGASGYSNFKKNLPFFAAQGYHALAPDLPGFGLSDKPDDIDYTTDLHVDAMRQLVEAKALESVVPVGNSLGGSVALEFTFAFPKQVPALILMAPGGLVDPQTFWGQTEGGRALAAFASNPPQDADGFRKMLGLLVHDPAQLDDATIDERWPIARTQPARVFTSVRIRPTWQQLEQLHCPVLCFWGAADRFLPPSQALVLLERAPRAKVVMANRCGHWYMLEQPDDFNREVIDFLGALG